MARSARSSAKFISYDLRPAKQSERRLLLEILKLGGDCGLPVNEYKYVGMGANRFYDFLLIHKYLGLRDMVSLEHDAAMFKRAEFNAPYKFIDVRNESTTTFLGANSSERNEVIWLDYDGGIGVEVVADIATIGTRAKLGDFCFVTVSGAPPRSMESKSDSERLTELHETFGDVGSGVVLADVERSEFPIAVHKILVSAFRNAFSARRDGKFLLLLQAEYSDSFPMVTVGGAFIADGTAGDYRRRINQSLPFLNVGTGEMYEIRSLHLTERERALFDRATTAPKTASKERNLLKSLGFKDAELKAYKELLRYLPRYVETMV